jgi:hypothetical protein
LFAAAEKEWIRSDENRLGVKLIVLNAANEDEIDASFVTMTQKGAGADGRSRRARSKAGRNIS